MEPMTPDYNDNCSIQQNTIKNSMDVIIKAMDDWMVGSHEGASMAVDYFERDNTKPFNIADFGCAHGRSSNYPLSVIISQYRKKYQHNDITVYHNDLPQNDFSQLHSELASNPLSYVRISPNIYTLTAGQSFYKQVFPSNSIDFAIGFNCFHWSSKLSMPFRDSIYHEFTNDHHLQRVWKYDTIQDLITILTNRGKELKVGGTLVANLLSNDNNGFEQSRQFYKSVKRIWEGMADESIITQHESDLMVYPFRFYSRDDIEQAMSSPSVSEQGLRVKFMQIRQTDCPIRPLLRSHGIKSFVERLFKTFSAFTEPTWRSNIQGDSLHIDNIWKIYTERFVQYFTENPQHGCIPNNYYLVQLEKAPRSTIDIVEDNQGSASC